MILPVLTLLTLFLTVLRSAVRAVSGLLERETLGEHMSKAQRHSVHCQCWECLGAEPEEDRWKALDTDAKRRKSGGDFYADGFNDGVEALFAVQEAMMRQWVGEGRLDWGEYDEALRKIGFRVVRLFYDNMLIEPIY